MSNQSFSPKDPLRLVDRSKDRYYSIAISSVWELGKLRSARALVVGAGALGNEVCKNLAMMGVKMIAVLDRDTVEIANLTRSAFFREADHGRFKAEVLCERLKELNPDITAIPLVGDLNEVLGLGLLRRMDMVFSCLDSRFARWSLNRKCEKLGVPWVDGAMENLLGEVAVYVPDQGPCYECTLTPVEHELLAQVVSCKGIVVTNLALGKVPTTSTMGSIVAAVQVQEAVKLLHRDFANALVGKRLVVNANINDFYITGADRKPDCMAHARYGAVTELETLSVEKASARDLLKRFRQETGQDGAVSLGREIVFELRCGKCGIAERLGRPIYVIHEEQMRCSQCGSVRQRGMTHSVSSDDPWAEWPLSRLGIPRLEVLEVQGADSSAFYELTGDLTSFPSAVRGSDEVTPQVEILR